MICNVCFVCWKRKITTKIITIIARDRRTNAESVTLKQMLAGCLIANISWIIKKRKTSTGYIKCTNMREELDNRRNDFSLQIEICGELGIDEQIDFWSGYNIHTRVQNLHQHAFNMQGAWKLSKLGTQNSPSAGFLLIIWQSPLRENSPHICHLQTFWVALLVEIW